MKLIVITNPQFFEKEATAITSLFRAGLNILHLRKPGASEEETVRLLHRFPTEYMQRIVTHDHFWLVPAFGLKGIHLSRRNPQVPAGYTGHVSRSCHSFDEVAKWKPACNYVFLSPIYNSISKKGYSSAYSREDLWEAQQTGIIDSKVVALGGIRAKYLSDIHSFGFGGAALLGDIWERADTDFISHFQALKQHITLLDSSPSFAF